MGIIVTLLGGVLLVSILVDGFETIVLPRRVTRRLRLAPIPTAIAPLGHKSPCALSFSKLPRSCVWRSLSGTFCFDNA